VDIVITIGQVGSVHVRDVEVSGVDEAPATVSPLFRTQEAHIRDALGRVPPKHWVTIPPIRVGDRPGRGGGYVRNPPTIFLNRRTFGARWNRRWLFTLLHEIGHAVDHRLGNIVERFVAQSGRTGRYWQAYRAIDYRGTNRRSDGTPQYGEHFAEGYALLLTRPHVLSPVQRSVIGQMCGLPPDWAASSGTASPPHGPSPAAGRR
jgi:hypothetical protein